MKADELMIGDLVLIHEPECKGHRIDYISEIDEEVGADGELYQIDDIKPIPLTAEILEKLGFQQISTNKYISGKVTIAIFADEFLITIKSGNARAMFTFKYVHQLQHALRLCNIEKEIEL